MSNIKVIAADTHTPEYLLHKYWARKPHNIISNFISEIVPENGVVVDPFCGSGVVLRESQKLGRSAYGFDINPTAILITKVLINPPETNQFLKTVSDILNSIESIVIDSFSENGRQIRYCVHSIVTKCPKCETILNQSAAIAKGKSLFCPKCNSKLRFNLENLIDTQITGVFFENEKEIDTSLETCNRQHEKSSRELFLSQGNSCSYDFYENRRILAFDGMNTQDLFTKRNFSILRYISDKFSNIQEPKIRDAALLLLSASVAQCSRLIATRNNLSTGGPAWSIPGFWVPAVHLETNPLIHLKARLAKFSRGLSRISENTTTVQTSIEKQDARVGLRNLTERGIKSDLVFFDPPYGDNVPYVEFSSMWNSFIKDFPNPADDISVSDRISKSEAWRKYEADISSTIVEIKNNLKPTGRLLITFNNNDIRAWKSLLSSLQMHNMTCEYVTYQIPAVVSSKAQKSIESSYVSDIYSIYKVTDDPQQTKSLESVTNALINCARFRGGKVSKSLIQRTMILAWIKNNISAELLDNMDSIKNSLFEEKDGILYLKNYEINIPSEFERTVVSVAEKILKEGPCEWRHLYEKASAAVADFGIPDPFELRSALTNHVIFDGSRCLAHINPNPQMSFFDLQDL